MLSRPRLRRSISSVGHDGRELFLLEETRAHLFQGAIYARLAPLLDGTRALEDLVRDAAPHAMHEVFLALGQLENRGCLVEGPPRRPDAESAWYEMLGGEAPDAPPRVALRATGAVDVDRLRACLEQSGLPPRDDGDLTVVACDDYLRPELGTVNREHLRSGRPWMLVKPNGLVPWIGPIFVPGRTGCWSCLAQRLRANRQMEKYVLDRSPEGTFLTRSRAALPATATLAAEVAVLELLRWHAAPEAPGTLAGRLLSLDLLAPATREHALVKRPQCGDCGDRALAAADPRIRLEPSPKRFRADGGHRTRTPAETLARYEHHVSPITGAVTDLRPALGKYDSELTPAFVAGHNFAMGVDSVVFLKDSLRGLSGGKGASVTQAKVSGLCEALERYSGMFGGDERVVRGRLDRLGSKAIHPNACMGFSDDQYRRRDEKTDFPPSRYTMVPQPFDPTREVSWTRLWSLTHDEERLLPTAYAYYGHPEFKDLWCMPDSNGCASGNTLEEAVLQGFMELVERDAVALWWYNRLPRAEVDVDSFEIGYLRQVQEHYARMGRSLYVLDITSDFGVTTLACVSARLSAPTEDIVVGFGAHFDPKVALLRAVTEVNQFLPSVSYSRPDGTTIYLFGDDLASHWWRTARLAEHPYLRPHPSLPRRTASDFVDPSTDDLGEDVRLCVELARRRGLETMVLDQSRPDIGLRVARVVVPGICHFWRRFGHRRLYDVPVAQGWLDAPLPADRMNPYTIFF